jgi:DNA polymerase-3 subunit beta
MKFSIPKSELQRGLARLQSLVEKRSTMPILANVLLVAGKEKKDGWLQLAATDLEVGVRSRHPCEVAEAGEVTVSAKKLYEIIRELPDEVLKVEVSPNSYLALDCARTHFTLAGNAAEEYPTLPQVSLEQMVPIQAVQPERCLPRATSGRGKAADGRYGWSSACIRGPAPRRSAPGCGEGCDPAPQGVG